jgi:hypothetical protein
MSNIRKVLWIKRMDVKQRRATRRVRKEVGERRGRAWRTSGGRIDVSDVSERVYGIRTYAEDERAHCCEPPDIAQFDIYGPVVLAGIANQCLISLTLDSSPLSVTPSFWSLAEE